MGGDLSSSQQPEEIQPIAWLTATVEDVAAVDLDMPLQGLATIDYHEAADVYRARAEAAEASQDHVASRIHLMLSAALDIRLTCKNPHDPYDAMAIFGDRRTAIPADFRDVVPVLVAMAEKSRNALIRSRFADIAWLLERRRRGEALTALAAYVDLIEGLFAGRLRVRFADERPPHAFSHDAAVLLRRALQIARWLKGDEPILKKVDDLAVSLRDAASAANDPVALSRIATISLDFSLSDPVAIAKQIEALIAGQGQALDIDSRTDLWRLASRAYGAARIDTDRYRCQGEAAETLVTLADGRSSPFVQAKFLADAIAELHGIPGKKDRRRELQHRLVDIQANVVDELSVFRHEAPIGDIVERTIETFEQLDLAEMLVAFIGLTEAQEPATLIEEARKQIAAHPLAAIIGASHLDHDGKVIHRTEGGLDDKAVDAGIVDQIVKTQMARRSLVVSAGVEPARQVMISRHLMADDLLGALVRCSPFVDPRHDHTFTHGLASFMRGDRISAIYTLVPLLEASLRFVLKQAGYDVTIFNAATQTQEDRQLSSLFLDLREPLESLFGAPMVHELEYLFLKRPGPALRHAVAHALLTDGGPYGADAIYACWLMFKLMLIPLASSDGELRRLVSRFDPASMTPPA